MTIPLPLQLKQMSASGWYLTVLIVLLCYGCKKDDPQNNGGNGGSGNFDITGPSSPYLYWGEELTLNGTGLSNNTADYQVRWEKNPYFTGCDTAKALQVVNAGSTSLKVKIPLFHKPAGTTYPNYHWCGPEKPVGERIIVTMKGKSDTITAPYLLGPPTIKSLKYTSTNSTFAVIPGDSTRVEINGAGPWPLAFGMHNQASYQTLVKNVQLSVIEFTGGGPLDLAWNADIYTNGADTWLNPNIYCERKCPNDADWNQGRRLLRFKAQVSGTDRWDTASFYVAWLPNTKYNTFEGPVSISKSSPPTANPQWKIKGKYMWYETAAFYNGNTLVTTIAITANNKFYDEGVFTIPLAQLQSHANGFPYTVYAKTSCGTGTLLGTITIFP